MSQPWIWILANETPEVRRLTEQLSSEGIRWYWSSQSITLGRNDGPDYRLDATDPWILLRAYDQPAPTGTKKPILDLFIVL